MSTPCSKLRKQPCVATAGCKYVPGSGCRKSAFKKKAPKIGSRGGLGCGKILKPKQNCVKKVGCVYIPKVGCRTDKYAGKSAPRVGAGVRGGLGCSRVAKPKQNCDLKAGCVYVPKVGCRKSPYSPRAHIGKVPARALSPRAPLVSRRGSVVRGASSPAKRRSSRARRTSY